MLFSTEGEYVGLSKISTEIFFVRDVPVFMGIQIKYPIIVHVDNTGAFFSEQQDIGTEDEAHSDLVSFYSTMT